MRWREIIGRFMIGRYGTDQLNRTLLIVSLICMVVSNFGFTFLLYGVGLVLLIICNLRMFSRNHQARYKENMIYINQLNKIKGLFGKSAYNNQADKTHHIYPCPNCKQKIRIPKGKGKIMVRCPKCGNEFKKKS